MSMIIILLYLLSFLLIWQFVGYPSLMGIVALKSKPENKGYYFLPFVSYYCVDTAFYKKKTNVNRELR